VLSGLWWFVVIFANDAGEVGPDDAGIDNSLGSHSFEMHPNVLGLHVQEAADNMYRLLEDLGRGDSGLVSL